MNQIIFYSAVTDSSAENFLRELHFQEEMENEVDLLLNSGGGSVTAGYGMISAFKKFPFKKQIHVHGGAGSMMAAFLFFMPKGSVTALKQTSFTIHRAGSFFEADEATKKTLTHMNKEMMEAFTKKVDVLAFERIAEVSVDRVFDTEQPRIDVALTAEEALKIGLVDELEDLNSDQIDAINTSMMEIAASYEAPILIPNKFVNKNKRKMDKQFTQGDIDAAVKAGIDTALATSKTDEAKRVADWSVFADADPEAVAKGIASGNAITMSEISALSTKRAATEYAATLEVDNADDLGSEENGTPSSDEGQDADAEEIKLYNAELRAELGLDNADKK